MGRLIKAEFRKLFSTRIWWVLLLCTALLGLLWSAVFGAAGAFLAGQLSNEPAMAGAGFDTLPFAVFGFSRAINIAAIFPMAIGALAISGENYRKTITTSYLVAPSRDSLLGAKLIVYGIIGLVYGIVICGVASLGLLLGAQHAQLPNASGWLALFASGVLSSVLWTLLGVGVGALFGNVVASLLGLLGYTVVLENTLLFMLPGSVGAFLPNNAADSITASIASQYVFDNSGTLGQRLAGTPTGTALVHAAAGGSSDLGWLVSALVFFGYVVLFVAGGWLVSRYRDVG